METLPWHPTPSDRDRPQGGRTEGVRDGNINFHYISLCIFHHIFFLNNKVKTKLTLKIPKVCGTKKFDLQLSADSFWYLPRTRKGTGGMPASGINTDLLRPCSQFLPKSQNSFLRNTKSRF